MSGNCPDDIALRQTWHDFCDRLKDAGELIFRDTAPNTALDRAVGLRYLARNIGLGLAFELENSDPLHPELMQYFNPTRKQGGDNADANYVGAPVNGTDTYRIHGDRGSAHFFAVTVLETGETPWGGGVVGSLFGDQLVCDENGYFELILSPDPHPGNWIRTTPNTMRVTFRQFFSDWQNERPMQAVIERMGAQEAPQPLTPEQLQQGLLAAADWVRFSTHYWAEKMDLWKARPGEFISFRELEQRKIDATPGGVPLICYWQAQPDEAVILRVTPPSPLQFWNLEFGSYWFETMDYRYRQSALNSTHGQLEEDGSLLAVISHGDPGIANWLDTAGHCEGYVTLRWMGAETSPRPDYQVVKLSELSRHLPPTARRITPAERAEQIRQRRLGLYNRFHYLA